MHIQMPDDDQSREMVALPLRLLNGWLFGIEVDRVKAHLRETILTYQRECYDALFRYWHDGAAVNPRAAAARPSAASVRTLHAPYPC